MVSLNIHEMLMVMFVKYTSMQQAFSCNSVGTWKVPDLGRTGRVEKEILGAWADAAWGSGIHNERWVLVTASWSECWFQEEGIGGVVCGAKMKINRDSVPMQRVKMKDPIKVLG